jgi:hypothetical protein
MIVKETERAEEKKEKQKKKQKQNIKRRNERKTLNSTAPKSPRKCLGDVPCCLFFVDFVPKSSGTERRRYRNEGLGGFLGPSASR